MATTPKDSLTSLVRQGATTAADSAWVHVPVDVLDLAVEGVGTIALPVRAAEAKKLVSVARPAHFGRGEETLQDASVRDTWEITPEQVRLGGELWQPSLDTALAHLGAELGISHPSRLRSELHSLLVYGKGQFFAPHQDSEKHDDMVATLVVTLVEPHRRRARRPRVPARLAFLLDHEYSQHGLAAARLKGEDARPRSRRPGTCGATTTAATTTSRTTSTTTTMTMTWRLVPSPQRRCCPWAS